MKSQGIFNFLKSGSPDKRKKMARGVGGDYFKYCYQRGVIIILREAINREMAII